MTRPRPSAPFAPAARPVPQRPPNERMFMRYLSSLLLVAVVSLAAAQDAVTLTHAGAEPRGVVAVGELAKITGGGGQPRTDAALIKDLRADLEAYLRERGAAEHVSAAGLSVLLRGAPRSIDVAAGTTEYGGSTPVRTDSLWQIGSNTKAYTSVLLLQLEAEGRLSMDDPLGRWLPQYPQWASVTIRRLLNMTSGIPDYSGDPAFLAAFFADTDPRRSFSPEQLVGYAVGAAPTSGYYYSNTNYVLAEMIIERVTGRSYESELRTRLLGPLGLRNTFYSSRGYSQAVLDRLPAGYAFGADPPVRERDISRATLSWARGAGGILATTADMTRWERALYGGKLLPPKQQAELESLVSTATGEPMETTSLGGPHGFGLGIASATRAEVGTIWSYEGETFCFRALHVYFQDSGVIIAVTLNSNPTEDGIKTLFNALHATLLKHGVVEPVAKTADGQAPADAAPAGRTLAGALASSGRVRSSTSAVVQPDAPKPRVP